MTAATLPFLQTKTVAPNPPPKFLRSSSTQRVISLLSYYSTAPLYLLVLRIPLVNPECSQHHERASWIILGIFLISEFLMATLIFPFNPFNSHRQRDGMDFEENDRKNRESRKMSITQYAHAFVTVLMVVMCSFPILKIDSAFFANDGGNSAVWLLVSFSIYFLSGVIILDTATKGKWMTRFSDSTLRYSIIAELIGVFFMFFGIRERFDGFYFTISLLVFLGCVQHLRFARFYSDPLKNGSILTRNSWRAFLKVSYGWIVLASCMIWCGINLFEIMEQGAPKDQCIERIASALFVFIGGVPTVFVLITIVNNIYVILKARN